VQSVILRHCMDAQPFVAFFLAGKGVRIFCPLYLCIKNSIIDSWEWGNRPINRWLERGTECPRSTCLGQGFVGKRSFTDPPAIWLDNFSDGVKSFKEKGRKS